MPQVFSPEIRIGILGGGQLGRMLIQAGTNLNLQFNVLDPDPSAPCASMAAFQSGKLTDYDTVIQFGETCDLITIELENVNTEALKDLAARGKKVYPQPGSVALIQNKRSQKLFYKENGIPTADFVLTENQMDARKHLAFLPAVNKLGREGYDGRGVQIIRNERDFENAFDRPGFLERFVDFEKEISVIASRNEQGEVATFPPVEMVFHPQQNLVEYLFSPAEISGPVAREADRIARKVITSLGLVGLLAVEMFLTSDGQVLVNEVAPRPHNSGHQSIEGNMTSQYEQHLRAILGLPLGDTSLTLPSAMVNLLGEPGYSGPARYQGIEEVMAIPGVHLHLYGKKLTQPFRKMGHITIVDGDKESLRQKAKFVKKHLKVIA